MAYSTNPITLGKILQEFAPLIQGQSCAWYPPPNAKPNWTKAWAYKLREGISIALLYPPQFPPLAEVADRIVINVVGDHVEARLESQSYGERRELGVREQHITKPSEAQDFEAIRHLAQNTNGILHIKEPVLTEQELDLLATELMQNSLMLLRARDGSLTIAPEDPNVPVEARFLPSNLHDAT